MGLKKITDINEANLELEALLVAIKREQKARQKAEQLLEEKASYLFNINSRLHEQYTNASKKNQEIDYLLNITTLEEENDTASVILKFLKLTSTHLWSEASFAFRCNQETQKLVPITAYMISSDPVAAKNSESKFIQENFEFMEIHFNSISPLRYSKFAQEIKKINSDYSQLNHRYLCPLEVDSEEKYLIWFTFSTAIDLDDLTVALIDRGIHQLKGTLQKQKSKVQLLDNYKKLQEIKSQLIQSEKMASVGTMSAGIAHEINNPLSFLLTNSEVLKEYMNTIMDYISRLERNEINDENFFKIKENMNYILKDTPMLMNESLEGIDRIREIINGLKTFSRADDGEIKEFNVNTCIETSLRLVSNELKHKCRVNKELDSQCLIRGAEGQIIQVITNLLVNSAHAIEEFGQVDINSKDDGDNVVITIKDSGKGISPENLNHLFTPFFTTKPTGQGTGLGLSISYGIIKRHNGNIQVESWVGVGTVFYISIPITTRI